MRAFFPHQRTFNVPSEMEEERRLMYVGVTRAEEKLYLTSAKRRQMWGEYKYYNPSRFIEEIPRQLLDMTSFEGSTSGSSTFQNAVSKAKQVNLITIIHQHNQTALDILSLLQVLARDLWHLQEVLQPEVRKTTGKNKILISQNL